MESLVDFSFFNLCSSFFVILIRQIKGTYLAHDIIRWTIWVALAAYVVAVLYMQAPTRWRAARLGWTLAWLAFVIHVAAAFQCFHHWSHEHAFRHAEQQSGFGPGIFVGYFFTLAWTLDVAWWWLWPAGQAARPRWLSWSWQAFMLFILFNGAVVFAEGASRIFGIGVFLVLGILSCKVARKRISLASRPLLR